MLLDAKKARQKLILKTRILFVSLAVILCAIFAVVAIWIHLYAAIALFILQAAVMIITIMRHLSFGKKMVQSDSFAAVTERTHPQLYQLIKETAEKMNTNVPVVYVQQDRSMNAFAFSTRLRQRAISFTSGWLENADPLATQGVIAHELSHLINKDMVVTALFEGMTKWGQMIKPEQQKRYVSYRDQGHPTTELVFKIVFLIPRIIFVLFYLVGLWLSRVREYLADLTAAERLDGANAILNTLYLLDEMERKGRERGMQIKQTFSTHPSSISRINFILDNTSRQAKRLG